MVNQDFDTYQDEDDAAEELRLQAAGNAVTEAAPQQVAEKTEQKGYDADDDQRYSQLGQTFVSCTGKRNADGECIDARGDGQHQLRREFVRIEMLYFFWLESLFDHLRPDESQQAEGNPMIDGLKIMAEMADSQPSYQGHKRLKESEEEGHSERKEFGKHTTDDGHRKAIHR